MADNEVIIKTGVDASGAIKGLNAFAASFAKAFNFSKVNAATNSLNATLSKMFGLLSKGNATASIDLLRTKLSLTQKNAEQLASKLVQLQNPKVDTNKVQQLEKKLADAKKKVDALRDAYNSAKLSNATSQELKSLQGKIGAATANVHRLDKALEAAKIPPNTSAEIDKVSMKLVTATMNAQKLSQSLSKQTSLSNIFKGITLPKLNISSMSIPNFSQMFGMVPTIFSTTAKAIDMVRQQMMNLNDLFRYTAQGLTNFGRSIFFFISIPLAGWLSGVTNAAVNFENSMVRVSKITGFIKSADPASPFMAMSEGIRALARNSSTTTDVLAEMASTIAQMGVESPDSIIKLTQTFDMFAIATDQAGNDVANTMAKIANAFGWNLENSVGAVQRLASVINELENETAAYAGEIQRTMLDFAPYVNLIGLANAEYPAAAANTAAFAATLVSLGLSSDEAGTSLRNMSVQIPRHAEEVSKAMRGIKSGYETAAEVIKRLGEDPLGVFMDLMDAASKSNSEIVSLLTLMEVADLRGGRGLAAMAGNMQLLRDNLSKANAEWISALSLITEYEIAMSSTKNQIGLLRNNLNDAAITMGSAFLPVINDIIQFAVPGIRAIAEAFDRLAPQTKLWIGLLAVGVVILGPMLMFLAQIVHAVTLIVLGFGQAIRVVTWFFTAVSAVSSTLLKVGVAFQRWPLLFIAGLVTVLKLFSAFGVDVGKFFADLATNALTWGENLARNLGAGLLAGAARYVAQAIATIAKWIASFFEAHSPPKAGPLRTIDKWGVKLMETYLEGFRNADFSILSEIGRIIETELTRGLDDKKMPAALKKVAKARLNLSKLISQYNETGIIDEGLLNNITQGLGEIADNARELIRLQLRYNSLQERLAEIEKRRKEILKTYDQEIESIGASGGAIEDKIKAIRLAQYNRDRGLRGLDKEKEALEEQAALMRENIEMQKNMIAALQDQKDIFERIADILKRLAELEKGGGAGDAFGGFDIGKGDEIENAIESIGEAWSGVIDRFEKGKAFFDAFMAGLTGTNLILPDDMSAEDAAKAMGLYALGERIREIKDDVIRSFDEIKTKFETLKETFSRENISEDVEKFASRIQNAIPIVATFAGVILALAIAGKSLGFLASLLPIIQTISTIGANIAQMGGIAAVLSQIGIAGSAALPILLLIGVALAGIMFWATVFGAAFAKFEWFREFVSNVGNIIKTTLQPALDDLSKAWGELAAVLGFIQFPSINFTMILGALASILQVVISIVAGLITGLITGLVRAITFVIEHIQRFNEYTTVFGATFGTIYWLITGVLGSVLSYLGGFYEGFLGFFRNLVSSLFGGGSPIGELIAGFITAAGDIISGLVNNLIPEPVVQAITDIGQKVIDVFKSLFQIGSPSKLFAGFGMDLINGLIEGIKSMISNVSQAIGDVAKGILDSIGKLFGKGNKDEVSIESVFPAEGEIKSAAEGLKASVSNAISDIKTQWSGARNEISQVWNLLWRDVLRVTVTYIPQINEKIMNIRDQFEEMWSDVKNVISQMMHNFGLLTQKVAASKSAVEQLRREIEQLKDKTITITIRTNGSVPTLPGSNNRTGGTPPTLNDENNATPAFTNSLLTFVGIEETLPEQNQSGIQLVINHPVIRDENDIRKLAKEVAYQLARNTQGQIRYGANTID